MPLADYHEQFAAVYDTLYMDRDVTGDTRLAADLLGLLHRRQRGAHVLDFGCGSGLHVLAFAELGFRVTGFDTSPAMIARARAKQPAPGSAPVRFKTGAFSELCARMNGSCFDGAVSIFCVLNCMESPGQMLSHLRLIRDRLAVGARFLVEVWNGTAVFAEDPRPSVRHFQRATALRSPDEPSREIIRITTPRLDRVNQCCTLHYRVVSLSRNCENGISEFESVHKIRFLTPVQYRHLFELAGLTILDEFPGGRPGVPIGERDWYISYLVRRDT